MKKLPLMLLMLLLAITINAKNDSSSYNMKRALEELEKGNTDEARKFLNQELKEDSKNGYALYALSELEAEECEYGKAMEAINKAIKFLPGKDSDYKSRAFGKRAVLHSIVGDTIQSLKDFEQAIKLNPENEEAYVRRAQIYYEQKHFPEAEADYLTLIRLNPANISGYMGLGRNANEKGEYEEAIRQFNKVINLYEDYSSGYSFRAESYMGLGKYVEAADDIIKAIELNNDQKAFQMLFEFPSDRLILLATKLRGAASRHPHEASWPYYLAQLYAEAKQYSEAIDALDKAYDIDAHYIFIVEKARLYEELGDYGKEYEALLQAEQLLGSDELFIGEKADALGSAGRVDDAIAEWSRYIENNPDFYGGYYRRGFFEEHSGKTDAALEDYNMAVMLKPDYAYGWLGKADMHERRGETEEAIEAYNKVVVLDTVPDNDSCAMYALLALGRKEEAVRFMELVMENDTTDAGIYYDGACFYSLMGDLEKSLELLRTSFEKGYRKFNHVKNDEDLKALRETEGFKKLMEEVEKPSGSVNSEETQVEEETENTGKSKVIEIPFTPDSGCFSVKCNINSLPLSFIFDTGASTVSMSQLEANFMLKNGYLQRGDILGTGRFVDANGNVSEGTIINLREVEFGGLKLSNVKASVVRNQKAPLLLGQSVLGRLGSIQIDNEGKKLIINQ